MRIVYKRSLFLIGILIILIGCVGVGYLFYDKEIHPETDVVVNDELSINYLDGSSVISDGEYRFSVTNSGDSDVFYRITLTDIKGMSKDVVYHLTSSDTNVVSEDNHLSEEQNIVLDNILVQSMETQNFTLSVTGNTSTSFRIVVEKIDDIEEYFYMTILNQNEVKESSLTSVGEEVALQDEGLIEASDDDGATYYFRGKVNNNYVSFAGLMWRIIRINGDGTVRVILDSAPDALANYNTDVEGFEVLNDTDLYTSLNSYYDSTLSSYDSYLANTRFCSESGSTDGTYNAYTRIVTNKIPTFNCLGERFTSKIGLISADEFVYAGGLYGKENTDFYLYNEEIENLWWTSSLSKSDNDTFYPFLVSTEGELVDNVSGSLYRNFRPVISFNRNVMVTGTGTMDDPYVVN